MPAMPCSRRDVDRILQETDDRYRSNISEATSEEGGVPGVRSWGHSRVASDAPSDPARRGLGALRGRTTPSTSWGDPGLLGIFTETPDAALVPGIGVPVWGFESDQPTDLCLCQKVPQLPAPRDGFLAKGSREEVAAPGGVGGTGGDRYGTRSL